MSAADLHFHILPGVDDGPADLDESLKLARSAVAEGTTTVVATPHVRFDLGTTDAAEILARVERLRREIFAEAIPLELRCGGELGHDVIAHLNDRELATLAQGPSENRWVLVEAPFHGIGPDFHDATAELRARRFGVLIAHPERSADAVLDGAAGLRHEIDAGSLAQVNALSITGGHGEDARVAAWRLIAGGLIDVVASDAHGPTRPPSLRAAGAALLAGGLERPAVEALVRSGPRRLLECGIEPRAVAAA
jgi:protein-tyrosine phosphatase